MVCWTLVFARNGLGMCVIFNTGVHWGRTLFQSSCITPLLYHFTSFTFTTQLLLLHDYTPTNYKRSTNGSDNNMPDNLNNFYARFDRLNGDIPSKSLHNPGETALQVTQTRVQRAFGQVNPRKAAGPDEVSPRVLKACAECIQTSLTPPLHRK